jgi:membrane-associated protease RseP (regulator of RpoE activity)
MLAILSVLIIVHECGHFAVARFFGFQTPVFGFGLPFGPYVAIGQKWNTEFRVYACLLGGFVAIPELGDETNQDAFGGDLKPFRKFPIWQRALVAVAGVAMNMIFAYLVTLFMFFYLGQPTQPTFVDEFPKDVVPIAREAGIKPGDQLIAIDAEEVTNSDDVVSYLTSHKNTLVQVKVLRDQKLVAVPMTTNEKGKVGMAMKVKPPLTYTKVSGNFFEIAGKAFKSLCKLTKNMLDQLGQMFEGLANNIRGVKPAAGQMSVSFGDLHGVLAVVKIGADIAQQDWSKLLLFTILISMDLAIINLVPWPALDGGHLAFMAFEAVRGRPMDLQVHDEVVKWGFVGLLVLMAFIMFNDVTALITGKLDIKKPKDSETNTVKESPKGAAAKEAPAKEATDATKEAGKEDNGATKEPVKDDTGQQAKEGIPDAADKTKPGRE